MQQIVEIFYFTVWTVYVNLAGWEYENIEDV